jgi:arginyl-tRNA synthetase
MLNSTIEQLVKEAITECLATGELGALTSIPDAIAIDHSKHGDRAVNIAMKLAKEAKLSPQVIAKAIVNKLNNDKFSQLEIAGPGFINLTLDWDLLEDAISFIHKQSVDYGRKQNANKEHILIEYVSANPTGDLHLGHGRQAVLGSALASIMDWAAYDVKTEFYVNDAGVQIDKLGSSAKQAILIQEGLLDKNAYDADNYPLDSMLEFIKPQLYHKLIEPANWEEQSVTVFAEFAKQIFLQEQKKILTSIHTEFDTWYSEKANLQEKTSNLSKVELTCQKLMESGFAYRHDEALWFKAKEFGDERDRVLRKSDGNYTYLAADLAYHQEKINRGFDKLINLWGADHHGQIPSIKGGLEALASDATKLEIILIQMVSLTKGGQEVKMSKRSGDVVTIRDLVDMVGVDAFRYFLIESQANNRMVFDIELATKQDKDNPIYYIQYAHARCSSILRMLTETAIDDTKPIIDKQAFEQLLLNFQANQHYFKNNFVTLDKDAMSSTKSLILLLTDFPELIQDAAYTRAPYKLANYLKDLATAFHQFYTHNRVITEDRGLMFARLKLVLATKQTLYNALTILGLSAPHKM